MHTELNSLTFLGTPSLFSSLTISRSSIIKREAHLDLVGRISLFIFSGCGKIVLMKGPDGDIRECKGEYGFGGQIGAIMAANACVEEYEKVGYKRVE